MGVVCRQRAERVAASDCGGGQLYAEIADETGFGEGGTAATPATTYDPCFGARTFIPCRFTATSSFSAGFDDGGRPYVTTS